MMQNERKIQYVRPASEDEVLRLHKEHPGQIKFLAGGTFKPRLEEDKSFLVDLQDAGLDQVEVNEDGINIGGLITLKELEDAINSSEFRKAVSMEYGLNVRNTRSLSNFLAQANGRSPILCCLLGMQPLVFSLNKPEGQRLIEYLRGPSAGDVVLRLTIPEFQKLTFEAVGRSPKDLPIVCVAATKRSDNMIEVTYGGTVDIQEGFTLSDLDDDGAEQILRAFELAGDPWATAEYRQSVAPVLLSRVLQKLEVPGKEEE